MSALLAAARTGTTLSTSAFACASFEPSPSFVVPWELGFSQEKGVEHSVVGFEVGRGVAGGSHRRGGRHLLLPREARAGSRRIASLHGRRRVRGAVCGGARRRPPRTPHGPGWSLERGPSIAG